MQTTTVPPAELLFLDRGASWRQYELIHQYYEGRRLRITYHRGKLEVTTRSFAHESVKCRIRSMMSTLAEETKTEYTSAGSMTLHREDRDCGIEPDDCFWIANELAMRPVREYRPGEHPPPDLVLEIEVIRSTIDRLAIYAALGVPEVWRWTGDHVIYCVQRRGKYVASAVSTSFPTISAVELTRFATNADGLDHMNLARSFRAWVREQIAAGCPTAPARPRRG